MKKMITLLLSICISMSSFYLTKSVFATNYNSKEIIFQNKELIENKEDIKNYIDQNNIKIPDGYYLEAVESDFLYDENIEKEILQKQDLDERIGETVKNVRLISNNAYFPNSPLLNDWYQGPIRYQKYTFTEGIYPTITGKLGASNGVLEAALGFSIDQKVERSREFVIEGVPSDKKINVKIFAVYNKYSFDVYSTLGKYKGTEYAYYPVGLYVTQETYNKI